MGDRDQEHKPLGPDPLGGLTPSPDAGGISGEAGNRQSLLLDKQSRQQTRIIVSILALLVLLTVYFAVINAIQLARQQPPPYTLDFERQNSSEVSGKYQIAVDWDPFPGKGTIVRPQLLVNDRPVDQAGELRVDSAYKIRIKVPIETTPGSHSGRVVLRKVHGSEYLPQELSTPISIEVTSNWWKDWFALRDWLIFVLLAYFILNLLCVVVFPAPSGQIRIRSTSGDLDLRRTVSLHILRSSWIMGWKRSVVPLRWVWKTAKINPPASLSGSICFVAKALPVLRVANSGGDLAYAPTMGESLEADDQKFYTVGMFSPISESRLFRFGDSLYFRWLGRPGRIDH